MKIYFPLIYFETEGVDDPICDYVMYGYKSREEAEMLNPGVEILEVEDGGPNPQDN